YASDAELAAAYDAARVFAFISDYEGFAMTPMEAIAHGAPVVLADTPVSREVYADGAALVAPTPAAIGDALTALLSDDRRHAALLAAGRRRLDVFTWRATAAAILAALAQAAEGAR